MMRNTVTNFGVHGDPILWEPQISLRGGSSSFLGTLLAPDDVCQALNPKSGG